VLEGESVHERLTSISKYDTWYFTTTSADTSVNIILESTEFDGLLELYDAAGNLIASNDNGYGETDAQIQTILASIGTYYIHVLSADDAHGNYLISINDESHAYQTTSIFTALCWIIPPAKGRFLINRTTNNNWNTFDDNNYSGIEVESKGSITVTNLTASDNGDTGAYLSNAGGSGGITISVLGSGVTGSFNSNTGFGLSATSKGTITVTNITANSNLSGGARLNNCILEEGNCLGNGSVFVRSSKATNEFNANKYYGLYIASSGLVSLNDIEADSNGYSGFT
jgi:hypothetical protein